MVWIPPQNGRQSLAYEDLPVDIARQKEKKKTATIKEEPNDGLHEKQKHEGSHSRRQTYLTFGNEQTALSCIDHNNNEIV